MLIQRAVALFQTKKRMMFHRLNSGFQTGNRTDKTFVFDSSVAHLP